jgi:hypothetical protein
MTGRKTLQRWGFVLIVAAAIVWVIGPPLYNEYHYASSCDSTEPQNGAQVSALKELKRRKSSECVGPYKGCQYLISQENDGLITIRFYNIGGSTGSGCWEMDCCWEDHIFTANGAYVRCDGCAT